MFAAYRTGDVEEVKAALARLSDEHAGYVRKSLAMLALQDRRSGILRLCFDQGGFAFEHYFVDAADKLQKSDDPETFKVLEESKFRELYPRRAPRTEEDSEEESEGEEDPSEVFDQGGRLPVDW